ncbi:adenosylhomocysteinase [Candidatus Dojkabacteria bacterium]|jgi:adenosylhomocysteinase|nr:adenosylhomocysteinase [Candidatus Dojkabacteria bacterium]
MNHDYWIKDIELAKQGELQVLLTLRDMPGIAEIRRIYGKKKPFKGYKITGCVWVTYETANFIVLLKELGADVRWCSDNRFASIDDACAYVAKKGIPVFAKCGETEKEYISCFEQALKFKDKKGNIVGPDLIIDDGCDISRYIHKNCPKLLDNVIGASEQTTCGITAWYKLQESGKLKVPVVNVNESITKAKFDNIYGSRESLIEGFQNAINIQIAGKEVVIFGFGQVGKGCAQTMRGLGANVFICEIDPVMAMQADMDGYVVASINEALKIGDIFITSTGCIKTIDKNAILKMRDGSILANMGHGNMEIDTKFLNTLKHKKINEFCTQFTLPNKNKVFLLCNGYLVNATGGHGHPPRVMSITFSNHFVALLELIKNRDKYKEHKVYRMTRDLEEETVTLNFPWINRKLIKLSKEQSDYINTPVKGPFKREDYRY